MHEKNDFLYTQFEHFFWVVATFFDEVARYEFGGLRQNGPETAQPASPVVEFHSHKPRAP